MIKFLLFLVIGAGLGALMGHYGKCDGGGCPLTANPLRGALWGLFIAGIAAYPTLMNALRKPIPESQNVIHPANSADFQKLIKEPKKVILVDFYADWCGPCRSLAPTINKLADEYKGRVDVVKVNVDNFGDLAKEYGAQSIPTVLIFKDGAIVERSVGAQSFSSYSANLDKYINGK